MTEGTQTHAEHVDRQVAATKAAVTAITLLNSGSWLALLSQADKLATMTPHANVAVVFLAWGLGAFFGTLTWLFVYLNTLLQEFNDRDPNHRGFRNGITATIVSGLLSSFASLACFVSGVWLIYVALS